MTLTLMTLGISVTMLSVAFSYCFAECHYAECHYAECHYPECRDITLRIGHCNFDKSLPLLESRSLG
jgi:hypothetical protein